MQFILALGLLGAMVSAAAAQEVYTFGTCPTPIAISREGLWKGTVQLPESAGLEGVRNAAALQGNTLLSMYVSPENTALSLIVMSQSNLDAGQGQYDTRVFDQIMSDYSTAEARAQIKSTSELVQRPFPVEQYADDQFISRSDTSIDTIQAAGAPDGRGGMIYLYIVQRWDLVEGCLVQFRFSFPAKDFNFADTIPFAKQLRVAKAGSDQ